MSFLVINDVVKLLLMVSTFSSFIVKVKAAEITASGNCIEIY